MATDSLKAEEMSAPGTLVFSRSFPPISRHMLALYCGASGDTNPIHVDLDFARTAGFPDVFAHGMLVMAFLGTAMEERVPGLNIRHFSTRFAAVTQLYAIITCEARISGVEEGQTTLEVVAFDQAGDVKLRGVAIIDGIIGE